MPGTTAKSRIEQGRMGRWQWLAVAITVGLNGLDGFDVLSISFASPGIAKDWGVDQATLGWVLSMELLGMAIGSILLGGVADKIGRRPTILGCLAAMAIGMWSAGQAGSVMVLLGWRLLTGLGIGGMLAAINAAAAEVSNLRWRSLAMALMVIGYPIGGVIGGLGVQAIYGSGGTWHDVFTMGAIATALCIPLVWFGLPETTAWLDRKQPAGALDRINRTLKHFGHAAADALSELSADDQKGSLADIFKPGLIGVTLLITLAYFAHITSFYFVLKWVPKIVVDLGFEPRAAAGVLTWANVGGASGGAVLGLLATRIGLKRVTIGALLISVGVVVWFGQGARDLTQLATVVGITGFFTNSAIVGLYSLFAIIFPTHVRATGTGFAIGVGRGGAALAPVLAGYLFQAGFALSTVAMVMACGSLVAALALIALKESRSV
ncbi:MFS transporter [Sandarakinorhabdus oryzae]|uniref:MFS transporter n=1 Tax=Sandarakinorhabdus oryzae TaxID=2675220 RepID=UPI0012E10777|nr:MFS transporter [Sandarakinorhabdus oryzae]